MIIFGLDTINELKEESVVKEEINRITRGIRYGSAVADIKKKKAKNM